MKPLSFIPETSQSSSSPSPPPLRKGVNSPKVPTGSDNESTPISQRNGKSSNAVQKHKANGKPAKPAAAKSAHVNGDCTDHAVSAAADKTISIDVATAEKWRANASELIHANKTISALSILIQHLTFNVSFLVRALFLQLRRQSLLYFAIFGLTITVSK